MEESILGSIIGGFVGLTTGIFIIFFSQLKSKYRNNISHKINAEIKTTETLDNLHNKIYEIDQEDYIERLKIANNLSKSLINCIADAYGYWVYHEFDPSENIPLENMATE